MAVSANRLGRYELRREIARSNDVVYEAVDPALNRTVAVKEMVLPPGLAGPAAAERLRRFHREARAAGALSHPNIVTVYEVGEDAGRHFIAMEYLDGPTLREAMQGGQAFSVERAALIGAQIAEALAYAHDHGVIHRDVKPDNVHLVNPTTPKLTDFGIARIQAETNITVSGQVFGTPSYMSPEQVAGGEIDARTDVFSLGVMLFEMVTGRKPFMGDSVVTITYNIVNETPIIPPTVPPWLAMVLRKALSKDPARRYASAAEMAEDLRLHRAPAGSIAPGVSGPGYAMPGHPNAWGAAVASPAPYSPAAYAAPAAGSTGALPTFGPPPPAPAPPPARPVRRIALSEGARVFLAAMAATLVLAAVLVWAISLSGRVFQAQRKERADQAVASVRTQAAQAYQRRDFAAAVEGFTRSYAQTHEAVDRVNLAHALLQLAATQGGAQALATLQRAAQTAPESPLPEYALGNWYLQNGDPASALGHFDAALLRVNDPGTTEAAPRLRQSLAQTYLNLGDQARASGSVAGRAATDLYQKAEEADPAGPLGAQAQARLQGQ